MPKKIIAWSEPTVFGQDITDLIENYYNCIPIKLSQNKPEDIITILKLVKQSGGGVILAGGNDVSTVTLGTQAERGDGLSKWDLPRDRRELITIDYCFEENIGMLNICRGFQIMLGVKYGLGIIQDISGYPILHSQGADNLKINEEKGEYLHWVTCLGDANKEEFWDKEFCPSYHHQAVHFNKKDYNNGSYANIGIDVLGTADLNTDYSDNGKKKLDIIEFARGIDNKWIACQGHPECKGDYLRNKSSKKIVDEFARMIGL